MEKALFYTTLKDKKVLCELCPHNCVIPDGKTGFCRVRQNQGGKLFSLVFGKPCAAHIDPIEKKPIYHVLPGHKSFSIGTVGCNMVCKHCQNWEISQAAFKGSIFVELPPEQAVEQALESGCRSIAYTYTEPTIFYEYMLETAKLAKRKGLKNIMVTNGYINPEPLKKLCPYIDAANVDLKGYSEGFYKKICAVHLAPVLETMKLMKKQGVWLEITNLMIPGYNDDLGVFEEMCRWISSNLGAAPLHISRFFPYYKLLDVKPTPEQTLKKAYAIAARHLKYVYLGNLAVEKEDNTYCPACSSLLVERKQLSVISSSVKKGRCSSCSRAVEGIWS